MSEIKEKDIVNHIIKNWNNYFSDLTFWKTEYSLRNFRVDIAAYFNANLKDFNIREEDYWCKPTVFFEVKHNSEMRDLIFELEKQIKFRDWYINVNKALVVIAVILDDYSDSDIIDYLKKNNIMMYQYFIENDDINTLQIKEYKQTIELI